MSATVEIRKVVQDYVEGMCQADAARLRQALHPRMCCIGHAGGGLEWDDREAFIAGVLAAVTTPDPAPWMAIRAVSVMGDVAIVTVEDIWLGDHYDDALTLLHHEGRWQIVSKVFHQRPPA